MKKLSEHFNQGRLTRTVRVPAHAPYVCTDASVQLRLCWVCDRHRDPSVWLSFGQLRPVVSWCLHSRPLQCERGAMKTLFKAKRKTLKDDVSYGQWSLKSSERNRSLQICWKTHKGSENTAKLGFWICLICHLCMLSNTCSSTLPGGNDWLKKGTFTLKLFSIAVSTNGRVTPL